MSDPIPLNIPPGFVRVDSPNAAEGRFTDGDKVRFVKGRAEKWSGWQRFLPDDVLLGTARGATSWTNAFGNTNLAFGTHLKLYAVTGGDQLTDITPIRDAGTLGSNPFSMTNGSPIVIVTDTAHGADANDFVTFSGATSAGGITIAGEYQIVERIDANSYSIEHASPAASTATGGGASVAYSYQINTGNSGSVAGLGWGAGTWGAGTWSTPRTSGITLDLRHWSLQEFGNDLLASPSGGSLYLWQEATDARAEAVANAPASIRAMFVTGERYIFALGTTTPMTVEWPDRDDITDWTPSAADTANSRTLQSGSKLIAGTRLVETVNLIWSDTSLYVFQYTGSEFIYEDRLAGANCGLVGALAFAVVSGTGYWMSGRDFHMYQGSVGPIPNSSDVSEFVFRDLDKSQVNKTFCLYDEQNHQIRWHYCSLGAIEPDRYVDVNVKDYSWTTGRIDRSAGTQVRPSQPELVMVDHDGALYTHNIGNDADEEPLLARLQFGLFSLGRGAVNADIMGIIPDCQRQSGPLNFTISTYERPNSATVRDAQTTTLQEGDEIADLRVEGRHFTMEMTSNILGGDFRLGIVNLETQGAGRRR